MGWDWDGRRVGRFRLVLPCWCFYFEIVITVEFCSLVKEEDML